MEILEKVLTTADFDVIVKPLFARNKALMKDSGTGVNFTNINNNGINNPFEECEGLSTNNPEESSKNLATTVEKDGNIKLFRPSRFHTEFDRYAAYCGHDPKLVELRSKNVDATEKYQKVRNQQKKFAAQTTEKYPGMPVEGNLYINYP